MAKAQAVISLLAKLGMPRLLDTYWGKNRLTVLAYHRINDPFSPQFDAYRPNVSGTPTQFEMQMTWIKRRFNVITLDQCIAALTSKANLPPRPLLITFDDGYLDNYTNAYPTLKRLGLPAVIFLMTRGMDDPSPPWWDEVAIYLNKTQKNAADLPLIGQTDLSSAELRRNAADKLLRALKAVTEEEKLAYIAELRATLHMNEVTADPPLFMNWDQVREVVNNGVACMPHTVTHPILTRVTDEEAYRQLRESKEKIEAETKQSCTAFAYPNGTTADYSIETIKVLRQLGYQAAFTLTPGPMRLAEAKKYPFEVKRIFLIYKDSFSLFQMKVMGLPALVERGSFVANTAEN
ncbi:MAG: polysaccharide deacetylase family protein [Anaerolineae bacterium]